MSSFQFSRFIDLEIEPWKTQYGEPKPKRNPIQIRAEEEEKSFKFQEEFKPKEIRSKCSNCNLLPCHRIFLKSEPKKRSDKKGNCNPLRSPDIYFKFGESGNRNPDYPEKKRPSSRQH